jgi:hypothetical protein
MSGRTALAVLFVATLPLVTPKIRGADEIQYFSYLRSMVFDHDLEFGNEYEHFYQGDPQGLDGFKKTFLERLEPRTGRHINFGPLGTALLWSPFYLLAHAGVLAARAFGASVAADGYSLPYVAAVSYASALYGFIGLLLVHDMLVRHAGIAEPAATWTVAALWLATPVLYYLTLAPGFAHAASLFVVSLLVWLWLRARESDALGDWLLVGAAGGLAALVREQEGLFLVAPAVDVALRALESRRLGAGAVRLAAMGGAAALVFTPQLFAYHAINGGWGPSKLVARKMTFTSPHFAGVLFDPGHGLYLWTPLLLVATLGLAVAARRRPRVVALLALAFLLQVWINGSVESWSQAGAFGARRFVSTTPVFAWGLAAVVAVLLARLGRAATAVVLGLFVWWNVSLMVQFGLKIMDRQRLEWPRVAISQVTVVPQRLSRVAWLFFTDRERLVREGR